MSVITVSATSFLQLAQTVKSNPLAIDIEQRLNFVQSGRRNIMLRSVASKLDLRDRTGLNITIKSLSVSNQLFLTQDTKPNVILIDIHQLMFFWHSARTSYWESIKNNLIFTHQVDDTYKNVPDDVLSLTQTVSFNIVRNISVVSTLNLQQGPAVFKPTVNFISHAGMHALLPKSTTFTYGSLQLQLRSPDFGNHEKLSFNRIYRHSRGGNILIFRNPTWPKSRVLSLTFSYLTKAESENLAYFLTQTIGQTISYTHYDGTNWTGIITNPNTQFVASGRNNINVQLEFQGTML